MGLSAAMLAALATTAVMISSAGAASHARPAAASKPAADCQPFARTPCLLPFPNNLYTRRDRTSATGLRVALPAAAMPANAHGQRISGAEYNRNDGFSPGSAMILHVPGLDNPRAFQRTGSVGLLDMSKAFAKDAPIVVIDEASGQRQLIYTELDANAPTPQTRNLMIVPGKELAEGHTFVVALRRLRTADGNVIAPPPWFKKLRDNKTLPPNERSQRGRYTTIFSALNRAGIQRGSLYEAWDFTVGSEKSLTSRLLSVRNDAFGQLGDHNLADGKVAGRAPGFTVTSNVPLPSDPTIRVVKGSFQAPCYLITCGDSATTGFHYSSTKPDALPDADPRQRRDRAVRVHRAGVRFAVASGAALAVRARAARQ